MESSEAKFIAERAHLEYRTEVRLFVACLFYLHVASKFAIFVCLYNSLYCITDEHFNMSHPQIPSNTT